MSLKPHTEKINKKKIGICSILGRIRIQNRTRIHHPSSGSADSDPHQNDTDPKHSLWDSEGRRMLFMKVGSFRLPPEKQGASSCVGKGRWAAVASSHEELGAFVLP